VAEKARAATLPLWPGSAILVRRDVIADSTAVVMMCR
jgi:hypothetical protein